MELAHLQSKDLMGVLVAVDAVGAAIAGHSTECH